MRKLAELLVRGQLKKWRPWIRQLTPTDLRDLARLLVTEEHDQARRFQAALTLELGARPHRTDRAG